MQVANSHDSMSWALRKIPNLSQLDIKIMKVVNSGIAASLISSGRAFQSKAIQSGGQG